MHMQFARGICICSFTFYNECVCAKAMNAFVPTEAISVMADLISIIMHMQITGSSRQWSD